MFQASVSQVCMATKMYNRNIQMVFIKRNVEQSSRVERVLSWDRLSKLARAMTEVQVGAACHPTLSQ